MDAIEARITRLRHLTRAMPFLLGHYDLTELRAAPIPRDALVAAWRELAADRAAGFAGVPFHLYLHAPFCQEKCRYCRYPSEPIETDAQLRAFLDRLREEASLFGDAVRGVTFDAAYVGGGTPNLPDDAGFAEMLGILSGNFRINPLGLNTCEMRPELATPAKARSARDAGFTRISFGVQSFHLETLRRVRRKASDPGNLARAVRMMHDAGFDFVNADLMAWLPGETEASFREGVRSVCGCLPETIILYNYERSDELVPPEPPAGMDWEHTVRLFIEAAGGAGYSVWEGERHNPVSCLVYRNGWDLRAGMRNMGYEMRGIAPKAVLGLGPFARSCAFGRAHYRSEGAPPRDTSYRGLFIDIEDEMRACAVLHAAQRVPLDRKAFVNVFGSDIVDVFPEEFRALSDAGKAVVEPGRIAWRFRTPTEASVYSKLFFTDDTISRLETRYLSGGDDKQRALVVSADRGAWEIRVREDAGGEPFRSAAGLQLDVTTLKPGGAKSGAVLNLAAALFEAVVAETIPMTPDRVLRGMAADFRRALVPIDPRAKCRIESRPASEPGRASGGIGTLAGGTTPDRV